MISFDSHLVSQSCFKSTTMANIKDCLNGATHGPVHILIWGAWGEGTLFDDPDIEFAQMPDKLLFLKVSMCLGPRFIIFFTSFILSDPLAFSSFGLKYFPRVLGVVANGLNAMSIDLHLWPTLQMCRARWVSDSSVVTFLMNGARPHWLYLELKWKLFAHNIILNTPSLIMLLHIMSLFTRISQ